MNLLYSKKIVTFIDILGFRELLENRNNLPFLVKQLTDLKSTFSSHVFERNFDRFLKYDIQQFSDSIIISVDIKDDFELSLFFQKLGNHISESFIKNGIVIRGAITYGDYFSDGDLLVSPAFVEAYELEKQAIYPRIIISKSVFQFASTISAFAINDGWFNRFYDAADDGVKFLNYLHFVMTFKLGDRFSKTWEEEMRERLERFNDHKSLIEKNLKKFKNQPKIFEKYVWLANYHNNFVSSTKDDWVRACVIDKDLLDHFQILKK